MTGDRLPSPDWQVRRALEEARADGIPFVEAWPLAVGGEVCDSYRSARGSAVVTGSAANLDEPPNRRLSVGQKRCAGCRFVADAASGGRARCTLYGVDVYAGVLWPHRTEDRKQWQNAIRTAEAEWQRSYEGQPSQVNAVLDAIRVRVGELAGGGSRHIAA